MFSVKNKSNIRQITPYGEFGPFESKTFYPISKVYANAKDFFIVKSQFDVFIESLPISEKVEVLIPKQESEEKPKQEEVVIPKEEPTSEELPPAEAPVIPVKTKSKRSF